ncbi:MAG: hypothetical protein ACRDGJ_05695, partial [Candidatus Limnocylindria bacterium]
MERDATLALADSLLLPSHVRQGLPQQRSALSVFRRRGKLLLERRASRVAVGGRPPHVVLDLVHAGQRQTPEQRVAEHARRGPCSKIEALAAPQ